MGGIVLADMLQGFRSATDFDAAWRSLGLFRQVTVLDLDLVLQSARHYRALRKLGITVCSRTNGTKQRNVDRPFQFVRSPVTMLRLQ